MNYKFELNASEINLILASLSKQPYESVAQLITKIVDEVNKQTEKDKGNE